MADQKNIKDIIKEEYSKCITDQVHFMSKYCFVQHPIRGKVPFVLYPFQATTLDKLINNSYNIILKSRQLGISTLVAAYALHMMMFGSDKNILVIATKQDVARNLVTKVRIMHQNLPSWLKNACVEDNKLSLRFKNGSQIKAVSSSPQAGRSEALSLLIIDEAGFVEHIDDIWAAAQQTLATGGDCIVLSTPNGVGNFFHKTWVGAEAKTNDFIATKLKWNIHPERDQSWRDKQDENLGIRLAAQECDADFITSGNNVIPPEILQFYQETMVMEPIEKRGIDKNYWIWQYPDYSRTYVVSADVARGDAGDYSALHVIDVVTLEQVAEYKGKFGTKEFGNLCVSVATEYNNALLVIENSNIGWAAVQVAIDKKYSNLFYSTPNLNVIDTYVQLTKRVDLKKKQKLVAGFSTTTKTRPLLISKLDTYFREKEIVVRSKRLIDELFTFIYNGSKPEAMPGYNDDLVMAYCIGLWVRDTAIRLKQEGIEIQRKAIANIDMIAPVMVRHDPKKSTWKMPVRGGSEDLTWLL